MSSGHPPRHESSSRTWWSLSSKRQLSPNGLKSDKELRRTAEKSKPMPKFSTLTSAFGLKTKKRSSFPVPEPLTPTPTPPLKLVAKPPLNDAARPQSRPATSAGPVLRPRGASTQALAAPDIHKDSHANRLSLLTLTDADPFAARGVSYLHSTQENRQPLKHTSTSAPEISAKTSVLPAPQRRTSTASTSSQSQSYGGDISRNSSVARSLGPGLSRSETKSSLKYALYAHHSFLYLRSS
jgi:hypothetical protein